MIAVDYVFYTDVFHGTASKADFERLAVKASAYLDGLSFERVNEALSDTTAQKVKLALCAVVDALLLGEQGGGVASESNDGISVTYAGGGAKTDGQRVYEAAALFLGGTGLLYRGVL